MTLEVVTISVAVLSLVLSVATAWATMWRRGKLMMARPPTIYFGPDGGPPGHPKLFLRGLLYATARSGWIVETMYARVRRGESSQVFNIWVHGDRDRLRRGSGLHVGPEGVASDHHFLLPADGTRFEFLPGEYVVEVYAQSVGQRRAGKLTEVRVAVSPREAEELRSDQNAGLYFDWGPEAGRYTSHLDRARRPSSMPPFAVFTDRSDDKDAMVAVGESIATESETEPK